VKERSTYPADFPQLDQRAELNAALPETATDGGIEVQEEEWRTVTAQLVYKMRCECGRSWFELEPLKFVRCPACHNLGLVSHLGQS
jgi:hypothetical protein